jgi:hypothetical protein
VATPDTPTAGGAAAAAAGMYTFKNPLQGVLLGPMVLALLSVGYNLHRDLY